MRHVLIVVAAALALIVGPAWASSPVPGLRMEVLVDGRPVPQYPARGTVYIEAFKGKEYAIRLSNPFNVRIAVALSVDGLNTIDARRTSPGEARKWVLNPYETVTIAGWQTDLNHARRFFFTSEQDSYAQWLGKTENVGVISAVIFRERVGRFDPIVTAPIEIDRGAAAEGAAAGASANDAGRRSAAPAAPAAAKGGSAQPQSVEDYAATGIGRETEHRVERIQMDLEDRPAATLNIRYEYRPQLARLGILPPVAFPPDPLTRREGARGFEPGFCPQPPIRRW